MTVVTTSKVETGEGEPVTEAVGGAVWPAATPTVDVLASHFGQTVITRVSVTVDTVELV